MKYDFKSLNCLEILSVTSSVLAGISRIQKNSLAFPASLKKLTLKGCRLPWICMSRIQSLPKLEVLVLLADAFVGTQWDAGEEPFQQLKFLKLQGLDINEWKASSINFPCLKHLVLEECKYLKEIPIEIGYIPTLKLIKVYECSWFVAQSGYKIQEEQRDDGNFDIKINEGYSETDIFKCWREVLKALCSDSRSSGSINIPADYLAHHHPEAFGVPSHHPAVSPACHHMRRCRIWNDERSSKRRPIRRKFSKRNGRLRLLRYKD